MNTRRADSWDGMLAKSHAVAMMDMRRTELCLGADAIRCQLEQSRKELEELQVVQRADKEALSQVIKYRDAIKGDRLGRRTLRFRRGIWAEGLQKAQGQPGKGPRGDRGKIQTLPQS